jgi:hypothetical protein
MVRRNRGDRAAQGNCQQECEQARTELEAVLKATLLLTWKDLLIDGETIKI